MEGLEVFSEASWSYKPGRKGEESEIIHSEKWMERGRREMTNKSKEE